MRNDCRRDFDQSLENKRYCQVAAAIGIGAATGLVGSAMQADAASSAASGAADAQTQAAKAQIEEARRQFDQIQKLLLPYTQAGTGALSQQQALLGLSGPEAHQKAIDALSNSPQMSSMLKQGENAILSNAAATGGLRGGNTQAALAQFRPQLLNSLIEQQYSRLSGLTSLGQNAAAGVGNAGQNSSSQIINALGQQGAAQAGGILGRGQANANLLSGISNAAGLAFGSGGFSNLFGNPTSNVTLGDDFNPTPVFKNRGFTGYR